MRTLPWSEVVPMLSINPDAATREDVARMAAELMECRRVLALLAENGGNTAEMGLRCDGSWCAEQAQSALEELR